MTDRWLFSIIIPARNEEAQLLATVDAARATVAHFENGQAHRDPSNGPADRAEIIVADNASTDRTAHLLQDLATRHGVRVVRCHELGAARARNAGAAQARGRILVFVDADTQIPAHSLSRIRWLVESERFSAGIFRLGPQLPGLRAWLWWTFWNHVRRLPLPRAKALPAFMFCTRCVFDTHGPFDESVAIGEEWPLLAGLYRAQPERLVYDRSLVALTSGRRMELQPFGYSRTFLRYGLAVCTRAARVHYSDRVRERASDAV